jgi:hypothetical protein
VCTPKDIQTMTISKEILPAQVSPVSQMKTTRVKAESVYGSSDFYPASWYSSHLGAGRNANDKQVTFVTAVCNIVRYSPLTKQLEYPTEFDIQVTYDTPTTPIGNTDATVDMVIIAPAAFEEKIQPLIDHKISKGVNTTFKSIEDIYAEYEGVDPPEQVKYFIKDAYDTLGIKYVLLFGGLKSFINTKTDKESRSYGAANWWVPVRYVSIPQEDDEGCLCDVYYGCLYNETGAFDSWDSSGDGVYGAWGAGMGVPNDKFDMYPEVYVSRLAVSNKNEVSVVVKKIINYESTGSADKSWYNTFVGVAGKTFNYYEGKPDGEYLCDLAYNYTKNAIPDLKQVCLYTTNRDSGGLTPVPKDIIKTINKGAGFVDFEGHGNPYAWNTIWFDGVYPENWTGGVNLFLFPFISNGKKLPVVIVGGCHNALYNVTLLKSLLDKDGTSYFCYGLPVPVCFCWGLVVKPRGGAIASTGCTGYGFGSNDDPNSLSAALEMNFFYQIGNGSANLGDAHSGAIRKYVSENDILQIDAFCITNWQVFGDPSLKFGGYSS